MRASEKSEGYSLITSNRRIKDIEVYCRKVHAEAVIESLKLAFFTPIKFGAKLFSEEKEFLVRGKIAAS